MITKLLAAFYVLALVTIVVLADRGELDQYFSLYKRVPFGDTLGHFVLMGIFSFLVNLVLKAKRVMFFGRSSILLGSLIVFALVFVEECSQLFFADRTFSLLDLAADLAGIWLFGCLAERVHKRRMRKST